MSVSLEYLQQCATQTGYAIGALEKVIRLGEIAADISRHPFLSKVLELKGGTALNLCFGLPKRLSVDLDFNYIGHLDREKMLADRPRVEDALLQLGVRKAYRIQKSADAFAGRKIYLVYRSATGQNDRIEVDLNFLFRVPISGTAKKEMWQPGELEKPIVHMVSIEEILIGKLLAYLKRSAIRDVWDLANLPDKAKSVKTSNHFRAWCIALSAILDHPLTTYKKEIIKKRITGESITGQLAPMLIGQDNQPQIEDLTERSWEVISPLLKLSDHEMKYISSIEQGELLPDLLFPDSTEDSELVVSHPAILWKISNVQKHLNKD
jgi:predicted nucleotidyltransferase component of viral defense system